MALHWEAVLGSGFDQSNRLLLGSQLHFSGVPRLVHSRWFWGRLYFFNIDSEVCSWLTSGIHHYLLYGDGVFVSHRFRSKLWRTQVPTLLVMKKEITSVASASIVTAHLFIVRLFSGAKPLCNHYASVGTNYYKIWESLLPGKQQVQIQTNRFLEVCDMTTPGIGGRHCFGPCAKLNKANNLWVLVNTQVLLCCMSTAPNIFLSCDMWLWCKTNKSHNVLQP